MKAVVTRVQQASVEIEGKVHGAIEQGFLVLLGVGPEDDEAACAWPRRSPMCASSRMRRVR